jgi:hypothetical protein
MDRAVEARFRTHVAAILERSAVPPDARDDVAEELLGHLVERWNALVADGLDAGEAAERAVSEFGDPDALASDFRAAFHSRLWASTIGVLMPLERPIGGPSAIGWLSGLTALAALLAGVGAVVMALTLTPVRAIVAGFGMGAGCVVLWLASVAVARGQRWAYRVAIAVAVLMVAQGVVQLLAGPGLQISLTGIGAAAVLLLAGSQGQAVEAWLGPPKPLPRRLGVSVALCVGLSYALGWGVAAVPDPTQIGPADVAAGAAVACGDGGPGWDDPAAWRTVTVTVTLHWNRVDLLPRGLAYRDAYGSALTFEPASPPGVFLANGMATIEVVEPGDAPPPDYESGSWGNSVPEEVGLIDSVRGIDHEYIAAGRTIRVTAEHLAPAEAAEEAGGWPPYVLIRYYHLDRFVLWAELGCGEEGPLREW